MKLIIVVGITCSGKSTYSNNLKYNVIHFDNIYSYQTHSIKSYTQIENIIKNKDKDFTLVMDGYAFHFDKNMEKLKKLKFDNIEVHYIYIDFKELYRLNKERKRIMGSSYTFKDNGYDNYIIDRKKILINLNNTLKNLYNNKIIDRILYIRRNNNKYEWFDDDENLLKIIN